MLVTHLPWHEYNLEKENVTSLFPNGFFLLSETPCFYRSPCWSVKIALLSFIQISTVGYGDITPETELGRLVAILTIIGALVILPIQIGRITFLASRRYVWKLWINWAVCVSMFVTTWITLTRSFFYCFAFQAMVGRVWSYEVMEWLCVCSLSRPYGGSFDSKKILESRFLVITGSFTFQELQEYLAEFYNPTHCEGTETIELSLSFVAH